MLLLTTDQSMTTNGLSFTSTTDADHVACAADAVIAHIITAQAGVAQAAQAALTPRSLTGCVVTRRLMPNRAS